MSVTVEQAIQLYEQGTAVIGNDGKISMRKEKGYRVQPTAKSKL